MAHTFSLSRINLGIIAAVLALMCILMSAPKAHAERKQDDAAHAQLCADLFNMYDTAMDEYYNKKNSATVRQQNYEAAQAALSDFRRNGCKCSEVPGCAAAAKMQVQGQSSLGTDPLMNMAPGDTQVNSPVRLVDRVNSSKAQIAP